MVQDDLRKPIYEVDCFFMDAVLATSFDWQELANRLASFQKNIPSHGACQSDLSHTVYRMAHAACHVDSDFSRGLELTLNSLHRATINRVASMSIADLCLYTQQFSMETCGHLPGFLWACATDVREGAQKILRAFMQKSVSRFFHSLTDLGKRNEMVLP